MPCRSGSPQGVVKAGGGLPAPAGTCADAGVPDVEMPATAAAAKATGTIELEKRSRMTISSLHIAVCYCDGSPQPPQNRCTREEHIRQVLSLSSGTRQLSSRLGSRLRRPDSAAPLTRYPQPS